MPPKILKLVLALLALFLSPMILGGFAGAFFIAIQLAKGNSYSTALQGLTVVFKELLPFLPYITGVPVILLGLTVIVTNRKRILGRFSK